MLLDISAQQRWTVARGLVSAMFAVVVSNVVLDKEEANELIKGIRPV